MLLAMYHRYYMGQENKRLERMENTDVPLSDRDMAILQKSAEAEGVDIDTMRLQMKKFRYML